MTHFVILCHKCVQKHSFCNPELNLKINAHPSQSFCQSPSPALPLPFPLSDSARVANRPSQETINTLAICLPFLYRMLHSTVCQYCNTRHLNQSAITNSLSRLSPGNDSKVDGLVNFEKLRMIAKEIRHVGRMASVNMDPALMFRTR